MSNDGHYQRWGDRIKAVEALEAGRKALPGIPILARRGGRAFHTYTRGMDLDPIQRVPNALELLFGKADAIQPQE